MNKTYPGRKEKHRAGNINRNSKGEGTMKTKTSRIALLIFLGMILTSGYAFGASIPDLFWEGELQSGDVIHDQLKSSEVWKINGIKGERVLIVVAVKEGEIPPEMYLFEPGKSQCDAHAALTFYNTYVVVDHVLDKTGEYALLIRSYSNDIKTDYTLAFSMLSAGGAYSIDPDSPGGNLISSNDLLEEEDTGNVLGEAVAIIAPYLVLPWMAASALHVVGEVVYDVVSIANVPGIKLYENIVHYDYVNSEEDTFLLSTIHHDSKNEIN